MDPQITADQGRGMSELSAKGGIPAQHAALPESVIRLEDEFAVQETRKRLPLRHSGVVEKSSTAKMTIGVPRSVIRRAWAEVSSGAIDDRTALEAGIMDRSSPEFATKYVGERVREYWRSSGRQKHVPFDPIVIGLTDATTPRSVAASKKESNPSTAAIQSSNTMNPQHKSPWGVYTFRDLWTHHSIPCTLLVSAIAFGCYGISTIVDIGTYLWAFGIIITSMILGTLGYLRSHFGKDQSAFLVPLFSLIFAWFTVGAVLVVADRWGGGMRKLLDAVL